MNRFPHTPVNTFLQDQSGAVTVDWVVLTAAVIGLGGAVLASTSSGTLTLANLTSTTLGGTALYSQSAFNLGIGYNPVSPYHNGNAFWSGDKPWAETTYQQWSDLDDEQLLAFYEENYAVATGQQAKFAELETRIDNLAVLDKMMADRGIARPDGYMGYADVQANYLFY
jgi:hypothetical protein